MEKKSQKSLWQGPVALLVVTLAVTTLVVRGRLPDAADLGTDYAPTQQQAKDAAAAVNAVCSPARAQQVRFDHCRNRVLHSLD